MMSSSLGGVSLPALPASPRNSGAPQTPKGPSSPRSLGASSGDYAEAMFTPTSTKLLRLTDQITGLQSNLTVEARQRRQEEERKKQLLSEAVDGLRKDLNYEIEVRRDFQEALDSKLNKSVREIEKNMKDENTIIRSYFESLSGRLTAIERVLEEDKKVREAARKDFETREALMRSLKAQKEDTEIFKARMVDETNNLRAVFEKETQKVLSLFDSMLRRMEILETGVKRSDTLLRAQTENIDRLTAQIRDLQAALQSESNVRVEQQLVIMKKADEELRKVRDQITADISRCDGDVAALRGDVKFALEKTQAELSKAIMDLQGQMDEEMKSVLARITLETQSREKSEEEIVHSLGASILNLQKALSEIR